jgi:putative Mg2+ transporter-C (MgtC) family protein
LSGRNCFHAAGNSLLATATKPPASFIELDLMRLPLGILSGMGFIGAGAILRRGDAVAGVTTAATLWFVTVVGLCLGGGQITLGLIALLLGLLILELLKRIEPRFLRSHDGTLTIVVGEEGPTISDITSFIRSQKCQISAKEIRHSRHPVRSRMQFEIHGKSSDAMQTPEFLVAFADRPGVLRVDWKSK